MFRRIRVLYGSNYYHALKKEYTKYKNKDESKFDLWWKPVRHKYTVRMYSTPAFMKTVKQRYACWHNTKYQRDGVFWGQRYKSVLVQNNPGALFTMAMYIENNALRKGLKNSKLYAFSSCGAAYAGNRRARMAAVDLVNIFRDNKSVPSKLLSRKDFNAKWEEAKKHYTAYVVESGEEVLNENGKVVKEGFSHEQVQEVLHKRGRISFTDSLHTRVRYMSYGIVYGTKEFCTSFMNQFPDRFSKKVRKNGVRLRKVGFDGLFSGRNLQVNVILPPGEPKIRE